MRMGTLPIQTISFGYASRSATAISSIRAIQSIAPPTDLVFVSPYSNNQHCMSRLSSDLSAANARPYFLWDETRTRAQYEHDLRHANAADWAYEIAKVMREGRDADVWQFTSPQEVAARFDGIAPMLGRRRAFGEYLLTGWRRDDLLR